MINYKDYGKKQGFIAILVLFLMAIAQIGTDVYLPSFPAIKTDLLTNSANVQMTFTLFMLGFAVSQLFYGPLSDRFGRKLFLVIGTGIFFIISLVCAATNSIAILLIARLLQGFGAGACTVVSRAVMQDSFTGKQLAKMSLYQTLAWSVVPITAPLLGAYIQQYLGWRYNFLFLAIISGLAFFLCLVFQETIVHKEGHLNVKHIISDYAKIFIHASFWPYMVGCIGVVALFAAFNVSAPLLLQETLKLSAVQYGWSVLFVAIMFTLGAVINHFLMKSFKDLTIIGTGMSILILGNLVFICNLLFFKLSLLAFLIPISILQIGSALIFPSCAADALRAFGHKAGKAAAIFGCSIFLGGTIASLIMANSSEKTFIPLCGVFIVITSIMLIAFAKMRSHE